MDEVYIVYTPLYYILYTPIDYIKYLMFCSKRQVYFLYHTKFF